MIQAKVTLRSSRRYVLGLFFVFNALLLLTACLQGTAGEGLSSPLFFPLMRDILTLNIATWAVCKSILSATTMTAVLLDDDRRDDEDSVCKIPLLVGASSPGCEIVTLVPSLSDIKLYYADNPEEECTGRIVCEVLPNNFPAATPAKFVLYLRSQNGTEHSLDLTAMLTLEADVSFQSYVRLVRFQIPIRFVI